MAQSSCSPWRSAFSWATVWVAAAAVMTLAYVFDWLGRPLPYELWAIVGFLIFIIDITLPVLAGVLHRSWRVGVAVSLLQMTCAGVSVIVALIRFAAGAGALH